jgi:lauroyl/myristoyl acyltransferase
VKLITAKDVYLLCVITVIKLAHRSRSVRMRLLFTRTVALLAYRLSRGKGRSSEKNLSTAFKGQLSKERRRAIVKGSFYQFWLDILSMPCCSGSEGADPIDICGLEHLQDSLKRGNGAILWESSYFGRRNLAKHILYRNGFAIDQVHASSHMGGFGAPRDNQSWAIKHVIRPFFDKCERSFVREIIYLGDPDSLTFTKLLVSRLRNNGILCISADGTRGHKFISLTLLGRTVSFPTGAVSLARITNTPILPLFCFADATGTTKLTIMPPLQIPSDLQREDALENGIHQFVALLESYVRMYPEQYRKWDYSSARNRSFISM